jgi:hypothetical protein
MGTIRPEITGRAIGVTGGTLDAIELRRIVPLAEASRLSGLSIDSLKRQKARAAAQWPAS